MSANSSALSVLDSTFLRIETDDTPMHVGVPMVFDLPDDAGPQFVADVTAHLRSALPLRRPFNRVLNHGLGSSAVGWKMTGCYPISLVFQGMGLNITCISYDGQFNIGIVGSRDSLPSMQKISVYLVDDLDDLDAAVPA